MCSKALLACLGHRAGFILSETQGSLGYKRGMEEIMNDSRQISFTGEIEFKDFIHLWES